jgi:hypothetical protein
VNGYTAMGVALSYLNTICLERLNKYISFMVVRGTVEIRTGCNCNTSKALTVCRVVIRLAG